MQNSSPLVSIIMPGYNAEAYIVEAIESVWCQSYTHWELIVIDDGSTDDTASIVQAFDDKRIVYIHQDNAGVSAARNAGLTYAQGEYITFLDADDVLPQKSLEARVKYFESHANIDMVHGIVSIRDENLVEELKTYKPFYYQNLLDKALNLDGRLFFNPGYMIRYSKIGSIRFQVGMTHCEDILFLITLLSQKITYANIEEPVYHYRVSNTSAMSNMNALIKGYFDLLDYIAKMSHLYLTLIRL